MSQAVEVHVETAKSSYPIFIGRHLQERLIAQVEEISGRGAKVAAITDSNVYKAQSNWFKILEGKGVPVYVVPAGEASKSIAVFGRVLDFLAAKQLDRGGLALAIGGGVVGDLAGYAAASYLRGIRFIQVPTTLLAMVDSSVGGKTGINIDAGKNLVGAFHQPIAVYSDLELLRTMPNREFASGMAEVIKHGILADSSLFELLESRPILGASDDRLLQVVERNCQIKAGVVHDDEKETAASGGRALLNLGHTFGHAVENVAGYGSYLHGEAIGIGLVAAANLSYRMRLISDTDLTRIRMVVAAHRLPTALTKPLPLEKLMSAMKLDKKSKAGTIRFVVVKRIGKAETVESADMEMVSQVWRDCGAK